MSVIDFYKMASKLQEKPKNQIREDILKADTFDVTLYAYDKLTEGRLHDCGNDEFFYVLKGHMEIEIEGNMFHLKEGDGILVKAGQKHKQNTPNQAWIMVVSKQPHSHVFYDSN